MIRHRGTASALVTALLVLLVAAAPWRFGGVLPPERVALDVAAFVALAVVLLERRRLDDLRPGLAVAGCVAAVAAFGLFQSLPWPAPIVDLLSPRAAELWREAARLLDPSAGSAPGHSGPWWLAPSLAPETSRATAVHWLAVAAAFLAAVAQGTERGARRALFLAFAATVTLQVMYGGQALATGGGQILGVSVPGEPGRLRGTFVNPDHFAFFAGLAVAVGMAWIWRGTRRLLRRKESIEHGAVQLALAFLFCLLAFVGLVLSGSRSGLLALVAGLVFQGALLGHRYRRWRGALWASAGLALVAIVSVLFGWRAVLGRWATTSAYELAWNERISTWIASFRLWLDFPVTGTGLGTFRFAFPLTQPEGPSRSWAHAHNDVLEVLVTTGVVGFLATALGVGILAVRLWPVARRGRRSEDRAAGFAALGALGYAFVHSLADFGLTIPANAFALAVLCGLAVAAPVGRLARERSGLTVHLPRDQETRPVPPSSRTEPGTT